MAEQACSSLGKPMEAAITAVHADPLELYKDPTAAEVLGDFEAKEIQPLSVDCMAPNLMVRVVLGNGRVGWAFGDEVDVDRKIELSSGCPKSKEVRVGATRGSGKDC